MGDEDRGDQNAEQHCPAVTKTELIEENDGNERMPEVEAIRPLTKPACRLAGEQP
jgi:hypothetical protein